MPSLFIALFLQGLLFQFGGLLSLGVNTFSMGTAAMSGAFIFAFFKKCRSNKIKIVAAFFSSFIAVLVATVIVVSALFLSDKELKVTAAILFAANLPLAAVEGVISAFVTGFMLKIKPDLLGGVSTENVSAATPI